MVAPTDPTLDDARAPNPKKTNQPNREKGVEKGIVQSRLPSGELP